MKISKEQRAALEAAGYTVKGNSVMSKSGGSVGGYNENGKIWSGSEKVRSILKSSPQPAAKQAAPTKAPAAPMQKKKAAAAPAPKAPTKGYQKGDITTSKISSGGGRGNGSVETIRRRSDAAIKRAEAAKPNTRATARPAAETPLQKISKWFSRGDGGYTQVPAKKTASKKPAARGGLSDK